MAFFKWFIGGLVGAGIGAAVWVAIGHFTGYEVGYIAWGIGLLAGLGVRALAGDENQGVGPGVAAVGTAVFSILIAKYLVIHLALGEMDQIGQGPISRNSSITAMADEIIEESSEQEFQWPEDEKVYEDEDPSNDYPPGIWDQAVERWDGLTPDEQQAKNDEIQTANQELVNLFKAQFEQQLFKQSFGAYDLLWFGLAAFTAFKVGSGNEEESSTPATNSEANDDESLS